MQKQGLFFKLISIVVTLSVVTGCANIALKQEESMDAYRKVIDQESLMSDSERDTLYQKQLWYSHDAWRKRDQKSMPKKGQIETDFLQCLQSAKAIEQGISEQIGGVDPIQIIHARASVEICMVSRGYVGKDSTQRLVCETDQYDVLPICLLSRFDVLEYR